MSRQRAGIETPKCSENDAFLQTPLPFIHRSSHSFLFYGNILSQLDTVSNLSNRR
jgi:hypothetical protein